MRRKSCRVGGWALLRLLSAYAFASIVCANGATYQQYLFGTLTGSPTAGYVDGSLADGRFSFPTGMAIDAAGNVYVADTQNLTIRKISPDGQVTTICDGSSVFVSRSGTSPGAMGLAVDNSGNVYVSDTYKSVIYKVMPDGRPAVFAGGFAGSTDGPPDIARFLTPGGLATDSAGNVYVADIPSCTIRKITPAGFVTTIAGSAGQIGSADGNGSSARFYGPAGVAVDPAGNVYVADTSNGTIRRIAPNGDVRTVAGTAGRRGNSDGTGADATFEAPRGIAVDSSGNIYVTDNSAVRKITPAGVVSTLAGQAGGAGFFNGSGGVARFNGAHGLAVDSSGRIYVADSRNNAIRISSPGPVAQMLNVSTRAVVGSGEDPLIAGFIVIGSGTKNLIFRAIGPSLRDSGVPGALADPVLELYGPTGALVTSNDDWKLPSQETYIRSLGLAPASDAESVLVPRSLVMPAGPGAGLGYTVVARGKDGASGVALVEVYDLSPSSGAIFGNLSTRGYVGTDSDVLVGGVIAGNQPGPTRLLARAIGPSLTAAGVTNALGDPTLELYDANGDSLARNDNWQDTDATEIQATGIPPFDKRESALIATVGRGTYTVVVRGKNGSTGVGLVEVYNLQQ